MNKETIAVSDKTVLLEEPNTPLLFGWLIDKQTDRIWRINRDAFHIGSGKSMDIQLQSRKVKDIHCSLYYVQDHFEINDNNTHTGTSVNGRDIKRSDLKDNDQIAVGEFSFHFKCFKGTKNG